MSILFYVEDDIEFEITCEICSDIIEGGDVSIRALSRSEDCYFHLDCYTPVLDQYIHKENIQVCLLSKENQKTFNSWLENEIIFILLLIILSQQPLNSFILGKFI